MEVDSKWLRKRKEEHGTSLWVQEWGTKHQIKRFFFRYRNHPKNLLVSYLSTHPTSTSTSIFKESIYEPYLKSPKCWERTTKKMSDLPTWSQPRALRLHHIAYQCLDRRGLMGWWVLPWRVKNPTSWRIHVLITSHNHLIFLFTTLLVHVIDSKNRSASQY